MVILEKVALGRFSFLIAILKYQVFKNKLSPMHEPGKITLCPTSAKICYLVEFQYFTAKPIVKMPA
jgi:hypothetical protein